MDPTSDAFGRPNAPAKKIGGYGGTGHIADGSQPARVPASRVPASQRVAPRGRQEAASRQAAQSQPRSPRPHTAGGTRRGSQSSRPSRGSRPSAAVFRRRRQAAAAASTAVLAALLILVAVLALGSSKGGPPPGSTTGGGSVGTTTATTAVPTSFSVSPMQSVPFVDHCAACATVNYLKGGQTQGRTLTTEVWYPTLGSSTSPAPEDSSSPLVLFAAGYDLLPTNYLPLIDAWVEKGFVVAAPVFPDTNTDAVTPVLQYFDANGQFPGGPDANPENDVLNQPRDVSYVLSQLLQDDKSEAGGAFSFLHKLFDPKEIGLVGQSDGASTIAGMLYDTCPTCGTSIEPQAVALLSGQQSAYYSGTWFGSTSPPAPVLVAQSTADACNNPQNSTTLYDDVPGSSGKYFLMLQGATHLVPYTQQGDYEQVVAAVTTDFLESELHHGAGTLSGMLAAGKSPVSSIQANGTAPALAAVTPTWRYNPGTPQDPCALDFTGPPAGSTATTTAG